MISSLLPLMLLTESFIPVPRLVDPTLIGVRTSPIAYPLPPAEIVAETDTPFQMVILAVASIPFPVILVKAIPL